VKDSIKVGLSFGLTSGIITTLGLMVGLYSGTQSKIPVIGGILTIAIADAFSDALGIHISQESEEKTTLRQVWESTIATFFSKFFFALIFVIPVVVLPLREAVIVSGIIGVFILTAANYLIAQQEKKNKLEIIVGHIIITLVVVLATFLTGRIIKNIFS